MRATITQDEVDALWLAARIEIPIGDVPRNLRQRAQLRIQRLMSLNVIHFTDMGGPPVLGPPRGESVRPYIGNSNAPNNHPSEDTGVSV